MFSVTGTPWSRSTALKTSLSMHSAEAEHARADVGHAGELEQALHRAVLAEGAVQHREHDVDVRDRGRHLLAGQALAALERLRASPEAPVARPVDLHRDDLVAGPLERGDHARSRGERDRVLARAAAEDDGDPPAHPVVVGVVVVAAGSPLCSWPT